MRVVKNIHYNIFVIIFSISFLPQNGAAQEYYFYNNDYFEGNTVIEFGFSGGIMNGMTDIGGNRKGKANAGFLQDFTFRKTNFSGGLFISGTYKSFICVRADASFGRVEAADNDLKGTTNKFALGRYDRNLSFRSNIFEVAGVIELHPLFLGNNAFTEPPRFSPYIFGGIGITKYNPQAMLNGIWYNLEPLRLEGQGFSEYPDRATYQKIAKSFPLGIGVRYEASQLITLRLELAQHVLATDYLDDAHYGEWVDPSLFYKYLSPKQADIATQLYNRSTTLGLQIPRNTRPRANDKDNDAFWNIVFKIGFSLNREKR